MYYAIYPILLLGLFVRMKRYHEKMEWQKNLKQYEDEFAALQEKQKSLLALAVDDLDQAIFKDTFLKLKMKKTGTFCQDTGCKIQGNRRLHTLCFLCKNLSGNQSKTSL